MSFQKYNGNSYRGRTFWRSPSITKGKRNHTHNGKSYHIGEGLRLIGNCGEKTDVYLREIDWDELGRYVLLEILNSIGSETISLSPGETYILERGCSLRLMESSSFKDGRVNIKSIVGKKVKVLRLKDMVKTP